MPGQVSLLSCRDVFVWRTCLGHSCSVEEKLEFERGEGALEEVEKFCCLSDMISCYGGEIGSAWKKFKELSGVLVGKQGLSLKQRGRFISVVLDQFCCTVVKQGNLLLRRSRDYVG